MEHPRPSGLRNTGENPLAAALLLQIQENQRLKGQRFRKRKRAVNTQKSDGDEKPTKQQKVQHYNYHDFCPDYINPGDCLVKGCKVLQEYIRSTANQFTWNMCGAHELLSDCLTSDCKYLQMWFSKQTERPQKHPKIGVFIHIKI